MADNPSLETLGELLVNVFHTKLKNPEEITWQEMRLIKETLLESGIRLNSKSKEAQDLKKAYEAREKTLQFPSTLEAADGVAEA